MNKDLMEKMDEKKLRIFQINILHLDKYCCELQSRLLGKSGSHAENVEKGKNEFESLCSLTNRSADALKTIKETIRASEKKCTFDQKDRDKLLLYHKCAVDIIDYCWAVEGQLVDMDRSYFDKMNDASAGDNGFKEYRELIDNAMSITFYINEILLKNEMEV